MVQDNCDQNLSDNEQFSGLWLPLVTPFRDGVLDEHSLERLVRHFAKQPIDGLILAATTGEGMTIDDDERETLVRKVAEIQQREGDQLPVWLGMAGSDTRAMVRQLEGTAGWPIQGYLISSPHYVRPAQDGLAQHFTALAEASRHPVALYNIPYRTGVKIENPTLMKLSALANIVGLKDCSTDPAQTADFLRRRRPEFSVLTGEDANYFDALCQGADGGILASAHLHTEKFARVRALIAAGDIAGARRIWAPLVELVALLFSAPSPAVVKRFLWRQGLIDSPEVRLPMVAPERALREQVDRHVLVGKKLATV